MGHNGAIKGRDNDPRVSLSLLFLARLPHVGARTITRDDGLPGQYTAPTLSLSLRRRA